MKLTFAHAQKTSTGSTTAPRAAVGIQDGISWHRLPSSNEKRPKKTLKMAFCSAVTLCFASIFSLVSAALLAIAFSTDNWQTINVHRAKLRVRMNLIAFL